MITCSPPCPPICSSINDSLAEIDENAEDAYEQLKALLTSRYTMDRCAREFELHKFPEIGDMKPSEMMRQMKALLPPDSTAGTYFMVAFLLRLPADMIVHIISQDFKDCNKMAEYADKLYTRRRGSASSMRTTIQPSTPFPAATAGRAHCTTDAAARRPARGAAAGRPPSRTKTTATSATTTPPTANRRGSESLVAIGSWETGRLPRTKYSRRRHDFFTG
jgi:hypothetical protein